MNSGAAMKWSRYFGLVAIGLCCWTSLPATAWPVFKPSLSSGQVKQLPPAPPSTPPPNRTRSGGSLGDEAVCTAGDQSVRALIPVENPVLTTAAHPTFLFYVPYGSEQVQYGEFSVLVGVNEMQRLYRTRFMLPAQPGIVSIQLPESPDYQLKEDTFYHWYFKLACAGHTTPNIQVDGWVQRVALTPDRQRQIDSASPEVWYDALAQVAEQRLTDPQNPALMTQWQNLLTTINATELIEMPIVGSVQLQSE